jgi:hypothetical protein
MKGLPAPHSFSDLEDYDVISSSSSSSSSTRSTSYWSVPAPKSGLTIFSLVFQDSCLLVDGIAKSVYIFDSLTLYVNCADRYSRNSVFLYLD